MSCSGIICGAQGRARYVSMKKSTSLRLSLWVFTEMQLRNKGRKGKCQSALNNIFSLLSKKLACSEMLLFISDLLNLAVGSC